MLNVDRAFLRERLRDRDYRLSIGRTPSGATAAIKMAQLNLDRAVERAQKGEATMSDRAYLPLFGYRLED